MNRKDTRPLTIDGQSWEYKIGRNTIAIYNSDGKSYYPKFTEIMGEKLDNGNVNPTAIINYIKNNILASQVLNKCTCCGEKKEDVYLRYNPFTLEIYEDENKYFLCNDCTSELSEDI